MCALPWFWFLSFLIVIDILVFITTILVGMSLILCKILTYQSIYQGKTLSLWSKSTKVVLAAKKARLQTEDDDNAEEEEEEIKIEVLISALKVARKYSQKNNLLVKELNCCVRALERNCWSEQQKTKKQSSIMSFFSH